jgi:hypothetical protein
MSSGVAMFRANGFVEHRRPPLHTLAGSHTVWICTRLVVPGRPEGSPAVMPTR